MELSLSRGVTALRSDEYGWDLMDDLAVASDTFSQGVAGSAPEASGANRRCDAGYATATGPYRDSGDSVDEVLL